MDQPRSETVFNNVAMSETQDPQLQLAWERMGQTVASNE